MKEINTNFLVQLEVLLRNGDASSAELTGKLNQDLNLQNMHCLFDRVNDNPHFLEKTAINNKLEYSALILSAAIRNGFAVGRIDVIIEDVVRITSAEKTTYNLIDSIWRLDSIKQDDKSQLIERIIFAVSKSEEEWVSLSPEKQTVCLTDTYNLLEGILTKENSHTTRSKIHQNFSAAHFHTDADIVIAMHAILKKIGAQDQKEEKAYIGIASQDIEQERTNRKASGGFLR